MSIRTSVSIIAAAALTALAASASGAAADSYGAIAFSSQTGAHGYSYDYSTRRQAEREALANCRNYGGGCRVVLYFVNACGALAVGDGYGSGYAWATSRNGAERRALANCENYTDSCEIVRWVCSK